MPIDERSDLDRLSRFQLYQEAAAWGIQHEPDLPKYKWVNGNVVGGMVPLLESNGVTRFNMKTVKWHLISPSPQERAAAAHQGMMVGDQAYPVRELSQSQRDGVDSEAILQSRISIADERDSLKDENHAQKVRIKKLEDALAKLLDGTPPVNPKKKKGGRPRKVKEPSSGEVTS